MVKIRQLPTETKIIMRIHYVNVRIVQGYLKFILKLHFLKLYHLIIHSNYCAIFM